MTMTDYPQKLAEILDDFSLISDRNERIEYLIEIADRFDTVKVPESIATQPYPEENHVQYCESQAYVWALDQEDGTLKFYFDVLNPQGLSAMAMSVILEEALSGTTLEQVAGISTDIVYQIFGRELSMGKGQGLIGIISAVQNEAKKRLNQS